MDKNSFSNNVMLPVILLILECCGSVCAIPADIAISGTITGPGGTPLNGAFSAEAVFYASSTSTLALQTITLPAVEDTSTSPPTFSGGVSVRAPVFGDGPSIFEMHVRLPASLLALSEIWYTLAFDINRNGLDSGDLFADRFQIVSVPYALTGRPAQFWATHGGHRSGGALSIAPSFAPHLQVCPFVSPAGGVEFDKISAYLIGHDGITVNYSFGIYDQDGNIVAHSGAQTLTNSSNALHTFNVSGYLEPSALYYTGWGFSGAEAPDIKEISIPDLPNIGTVRSVVVNGLIPNSFDPDDIVFENSPAPLSITLSKD